MYFPQNYIVHDAKYIMAHALSNANYIGLNVLCASHVWSSLKIHRNLKLKSGLNYALFGFSQVRPISFAAQAAALLHCD